MKAELKRALVPFLVSYGLCFVVQSVGAYLTQLSVNEWYPTLNKSPLTPPGVYFGIVWTTLYFLMALAATRIYLKRGTWRSRTFVWWLAQLLLGLLWSAVFFGHREPALGLMVILANWIAVAVTLYRFSRIDRLAAALIVPLLVWLSFATYLNQYIWQHN